MYGAELMTAGILIAGFTVALVRYSRRNPDPLIQFLNTAERWLKVDAREANCPHTEGGRDLPGVLQRLVPRLHQLLSASDQALKELQMLKRGALAHESPASFVTSYLHRTTNRAYLRMVGTRFHLENLVELLDSGKRLMPQAPMQYQETLAMVVLTLEQVQSQQAQVAELLGWIRNPLAVRATLT